VRNAALFTSASVEWATPQAFFDKVNAEFNLNLDVAATPANAKCARYYTAEQDGLSLSLSLGPAACGATRPTAAPSASGSLGLVEPRTRGRLTSS
jgi:hypothetical protein